MVRAVFRPIVAPLRRNPGATRHGAVDAGVVSQEHTAELSHPHVTAEAQADRIEGLDGLRLVAVLIVLARHLDYSDKVPGGFGVSVFFFISGLLITRLILAEERDRGRMDITGFFLRRFIRLIPPLALMGAMTIPVLAYLYPAEFNWTQILFAFGYLGNIFPLLVDFHGWRDGLVAFEPLWSLAVEEHFYLMLPVVLLITRSMRARIWVVFLAGCLGPLALRAYAVFSLPPELADAFNYRFTFTRIDAMGWGVLLTLLLHAGWLRAEVLSRHGHLLLWGGAALSVLSMVHWSVDYEIAWKYTPQTIAIGMGVAALVFAENQQWLRTILERRWVRFFGKASYEIYLWHLPIYLIVLAFAERGPGVTLLVSIITLAVAGVSYLLVTGLVAPLRRRLGSRRF